MPDANILFVARWDDVSTLYYDDGTAVQRDPNGSRFNFAWAVRDGVVVWRIPGDQVNDFLRPDQQETQEAYSRYISNLMLAETTDGR